MLLARVLAVEAPVILADEPTTSLDPRHQIEVMQLLRGAAESALVIVVTHDLGFAARFADTVIVLRQRPPGRERPAGRRRSRTTCWPTCSKCEAFRHEHDGAPVIVPWVPVS